MTMQLTGWRAVPRVAVLVPDAGEPGWTDAAFWLAQLEAWGIAGVSTSDVRDGSALEVATTVVAPAAALGRTEAEAVRSATDRGVGVVLAGEPSASCAAVFGFGFAERAPSRVASVRVDDPTLRARVAPALPDAGVPPGLDLDPIGVRADVLDGAGWRTLARWEGQDRTSGVAIALRGSTVLFAIPASTLDHRATEAIVACAERALELASPSGLVALWRWPDAKTAALVVDGDVDHPTGVDPECARYVAPALDTASRAGFDSYAIFAAAANVDAEPSSFPPAPGYYNHSYTHPYSYWDPRPWERLTADEMERELVRSNETFLRHLGRGDESIFRLPHFQLEASERTYDVLDRLGYRAESSIGANLSVTAGLPYHPARQPWSPRPADAAYARTHPDPRLRYPFLQLPISTDPSAPAFPNGCCSYNTLDEGVRLRTADPSAYGALLDQVVRRGMERRALVHVFIDPPDAGFGRLPGDRVDYASSVESWLRRCVDRTDLAVMTTAGLAGWWLDRERAVRDIAIGRSDEGLLVRLDDAPAGATLGVLEPAPPMGRGAGSLVPIVTRG